MKGKIKQRLEKIVSFVKDNSKKAIATGLVVVASYASVNAAEIKVVNFAPNNSTLTSEMFIKTDASYNEGLDPLVEVPFIAAPAPKLEIYSTVGGNELSTDARPNNTPGVEMDLAVNGTITGPENNILYFTVKDATDLEHRKIIAYDTLNPNTIYDIDKTVDVWTPVNLPDIVGRTDEVYARWRIETPALVPGDCASALGPGKLDGKVDLYDIQTLASEWLDETFEGENYLEGDVNYDRINNLEDFAVISESWLE